MRSYFIEQEELLAAALADCGFVRKSDRKRTEQQTRRAIQTAYIQGRAHGVEFGIGFAAQEAKAAILARFKQPHKRTVSEKRNGR